MKKHFVRFDRTILRAAAKQQPSIDIKNSYIKGTAAKNDRTRSRLFFELTPSTVNNKNN